MFIEPLEGRRLFSGAVKFVANMLGADEVPPNVTPARGTITFKLSKDGSALTYKLAAKKIDHVSGAHIHIGQPGVDGAIAVDLETPGVAKVGKHKFSVRGTITAANFTGPMAGHTMADLVAEMTAGDAYVNVHTDDGVPPTNTGPGDFPGGEIRGQLRRLGKVKAATAPTESPGPAPAAAPAPAPAPTPMPSPFPGY